MLSLETVALVNDQLAKGEEGRLFAVIHVAGKQFVVTQEDIIIIHGPWPPSIGDQIKLEKVRYILVSAHISTLLEVFFVKCCIMQIKGLEIFTSLLLKPLVN